MKKLLPILAVPFVVIIFFQVIIISKFVLSSNGTIHKSSIQGFAVSSDGTVFVGYRQAIEAYKDGSLVFTFRPPTSRAYGFYIESDKLIIGTSSGNCKVYDMKGNCVENSDLSYNELKSKEKKVYTSENGDIYKLHRFFQLKPFEIKRNGETILKESALDYHFHELPFWILFALTFINMVIFVLALTEQFYHKSDT